MLGKMGNSVVVMSERRMCGSEEEMSADVDDGSRAASDGCVAAPCDDTSALFAVMEFPGMPTSPETPTPATTEAVVARILS